MNVLVCGNHRFHDRNAIFSALQKINYERDGIASIGQFGGTEGPDSLARAFVFERQIEREARPDLFPAIALKTFNHDWDRDGPGAHHKTYELIVKSRWPDVVLVFGEDRGPHRPFVRMAKVAGIEVIDHSFARAAEFA